MHIDVHPIDPRDDAAFAAWFAVFEASERAARPDEPSWLLVEQQQYSIEGTTPETDAPTTCLVAEADGRVVGMARTEMPARDNPHLVEVDLAVHPSSRRRGVGRALVGEVERLARAEGRTTVVGYADEPPGTQGRSASRQAACALGYEVVQEEVRRDIDLPLDPARVAELERTCRPHATDYVLRTWWDRVPDDLVDDRAELGRQMSTDVPKDEFDWREEVWDAARVRRTEELLQSMDRTHVGVGAVHVPSGRMVAFTTMGVPRSAPARAYQWETLVVEAHRGHRLGTLVKLAALQELTTGSPATAFVTTWNAQENGPMIAVNDALGARVNGGLVVLQKVLA